MKKWPDISKPSKRPHGRAKTSLLREKLQPLNREHDMETLLKNERDRFLEPDPKSLLTPSKRSDR
jgi:hypothetical protein